MPHFAVVCTDGPEGEALRRAHLAAHLAHVEAVMERILVAGPVPAGPGGGYVASLLVIEAEDADDARRMIEADPYAKAGVWREIAVQPFKPVAGRWIGGKTW